MTLTFLSLVLCFAVLVLAVLLIFNKDYDDGLFGRLGLSLIALAAIGGVLLAVESIIESVPVRISPVGMFLWAGLAIFLSRHAWRFFAYRRNGNYVWREIRK